MAYLRDFLHTFILKSPLLSRFKVTRGINFDGKTKGNGTFSVVYLAEDIKNENKNVAVKCFDPDLKHEAKTYRHQCFKREVENLSKLKGVKRCAQIVTELESLYYDVPLANGESLSQDAPFYCLDWYPIDYDNFQFKTDQIDAEVKLHLLRRIILATRAIHSKGVYHRDLKLDNFRGKIDERSREEVTYLIDFGCSVQSSDKPIGEYLLPPGCDDYAPVEAKIGLSAVHNIQKYADYFAIGAILFELFTTDTFSAHYYSGDIDYAFELIHNKIYHIENIEDALNEYHKILDSYKTEFKLPEFDIYGNSVPDSLSIELKRLLDSLIHFDYRKRQDLEYALERVDICLKILENEELQKKQYEIKKNKRSQRLERLNKNKLLC